MIAVLLEEYVDEKDQNMSWKFTETWETQREYNNHTNRRDHM